MPTTQDQSRNDLRTRGFGGLLRHWRQVRRLSQLELAGEAAVSAKHLSFLETGRSRPSREMVHLLGATLDLPLSELNALHLAAGYAAPYGEGGLDATDLEPVRHALEFILRQQEPHPAIVIDARWDIRMRNDASRRLLRPFHEAYEVDDTVSGNAMHVVFHPGALRPFIVNWSEFAGSLIQMLHRDVARGGNAAAADLRSEILAYLDLPAGWSVPQRESNASPVLPMHLRMGELDLTFFTTLTTFAMPRDVALQQLKIECFYPADAATAEVARRLAAAAAG